MNTALLSRRELKANARGYLNGHYSQVILLEIISIFTGYVAQGVIPIGNSNILGIIVACLIALLTSVITGILSYGRCRYYMNLCCHYPTSVKDLFYGFRRGDNRPLIFYAILSSVLFFCLLPSVIFISVWLTQPDVLAWLIASVITFLVGAAIAFRFFIEYSQCPYLFCDFPDKKFNEILKLSRYLMRGRMGRLFLLYLSFIPMILLGALSLGLGFLWVLPYMEATTACFHLDLTRAAAAG